MKTVALLVVIFFSFTSFVINRRSNNANGDIEKIAIQVVDAFQQTSVERYCLLFPSLEELHQIMEENSCVYGKFMNEAMDEFDILYNSEMMPALIDAFDEAISDGRKKGIDWSTIEYSRIEIPENNPHHSPVTCIIVFISQGREYHLQIEKMFRINGEWRVGQRIRLV